jgi:hypothetical protein
MPEVPEILTKAADYIGEHGHHKGGFTHRGAVCARGAINAVLYGDADNCGDDYRAGYDGAADEVAQALADYIGVEAAQTESDIHFVLAIGRWNDEPTRTAEEVMAAMRACAAELAKGATS